MILKTKFDVWYSNLNDLQQGICFTIFGLMIVLLSRYFHKSYKGEGYKPFKSFRREGKTQSEDNFFIIMFMRSLIGIYVGYIIVFFGILKMLAHFKIINF